MSLKQKWQTVGILIIGFWHPMIWIFVGGFIFCPDLRKEVIENWKEVSND